MLVPSPKVATYDLAPAMSAVGVTDALVEAIESDAYDFIVANYANPDMVGHTGVWDATVEALDRASTAASPASSRRSRPSRRATPPGPARCSRSPPTTATPTSCATRDGHPVTAHSLNPVPFVAGRPRGRGRTSRDGVLADVAPTLLELRGPPAVGRHDRSLPHACASIRRPYRTEATDP